MSSKLEGLPPQSWFPLLQTYVFSSRAFSSATWQQPNSARDSTGVLTHPRDEVILTQPTEHC